MFATAVLFFCSIVAAFQVRTSWFNIAIKLGAVIIASWAAVHCAAYWGLTP